MAEIGLIIFARVALRIGQVVPPAYRSNFSKHQFTQPQLLAMLCLMRDEDWTFRELEVRVADHLELRAALGLHRVPDYTTLYRFLRRLNEAVLGQFLTVHHLSGAGGCRSPLDIARASLCRDRTSSHFDVDTADQPHYTQASALPSCWLD
jgi:Transposase domain (DUF772)